MIEPRRLQRLEDVRPHDSPVVVRQPTVPHIVQFAIDADYLGVELFPRQSTLLKLMFCSPHLLTSFDRGVLAEWTSGFTVQPGNDGTAGYRGQCGVVGDVVDRMRWCSEHGRGWFGEVIFVGRRRGSKSLLGAIAGAYVLWRLLALGDPAKHYAIIRGKQLHIPVFAGQRDQARTNQWKDLVDLIGAAPCFSPYVAKTTSGSLRLYSPAQLAAGRVVEPGDAALVISAKEATPLAGRGPATPVQFYDEMAHITATGTNRSAEEIFSAATPALAQFGPDSFLYEASSPWTQQGQFYANYLRGLAVDPDTGAALDPAALVVQLPSFELYKNWQRTQDPDFRVWPGGPRFAPRRGPILDEASETELRRVDPDRYDVEFGARWATSLAAYLPPEHVDGLFGPWAGRQLLMQSCGVAEHHYVAHADPSVSGANFALVIAHPEFDGAGTRHVVVDHITVWRPRDFGGRIDYEMVTADIKSLLVRFPIAHFSFDQFNSAGLLDRLKAFCRNDDRVVGHPTITERTATAASNHRMNETLKTALSRHLVHAAP